MATNSLINVAVIFSAIDRMTRPITRMTTGLSDLQKQLYYTDRYMSDMFSKATLGAIGLTTAIYSMVDAYSWVETAVINMSTALRGDLERAYDLMDEIRDLAEGSPLTAKPLSNSANILLSYGIQENELMDTLKRLGDLAKGQDDVLESLAMGYGRIIAEDRVTREHLDRFIFKANVPIYEALSKSMGISMEHLRDEMKAGNVIGQDIVRAVQYLTDEGGQFYEAMEKLNDTLHGQTQQFLEKGNRLIGSIGEILTPFFTKMLMKVVNPSLERGRQIIERYLAPQRETTIDADGRKTLWIFDSTTTENIVKALERLVLEFDIGFEWLNRMFARLEDGTSLFYDFIDILVWFVRGLKLVIGSFIGALEWLDRSGLRPIVVTILKIIAFVTPLIFSFVKLNSLLLALRSIITGVSRMISRFTPIRMLRISLKGGKLNSIFSGIFNSLSSTKVFTKLAPPILKFSASALKLVANLIPVLKIVSAITLAFSILYSVFEPYRRLVEIVTNSIMWMGSKIMEFGNWLYQIGGIFSWLGNLFKYFGALVYNFGKVLRSFLEGDLLGTVKNLFVFLIETSINAIKMIIDNMLEAISWIPNIKNQDWYKSIKEWSSNMTISEGVGKYTKYVKEKEETTKDKEPPPPQITLNNTINTTDANTSVDTTVETGTRFNVEVTKLANGLTYS